MLGLGGLGSHKKPRSFGYAPRHFDPEAEAREERKRAILGDEYKEGEYRPGVLIREGRMRRMQAQNTRAQKASKVTLIRTVVFVLLVFLILYLATSYFGQSFSE